MDNKTERIFSVSLISYNQPDYWREAVSSVLAQDYPAIDLVFSDDGSPGFSKSEVEGFIESSRGKNLVSYTVIEHEENIGTMKNLNDADAACTGYYVTHLEGDDAFATNHVLSDYAKAIESAPKSALGVFGKRIACDEKLRIRPDTSNYVQNYFSIDEMVEMHSMTPRNLYRYLVIKGNCRLPWGSSAFRFADYRRYLPLDTRVSYIGDWPFFLKITREGHTMSFANVDAILYRRGGISTSTELTPLKKKYLSDRAKVYAYEIFPFINEYFSPEERVKIFETYSSIQRTAPSETDLIAASTAIAQDKHTAALVIANMTNLYRSNCLNNASASSKAQTDWIQQLQEGKDWLEDQYRKLTTENSELRNNARKAAKDVQAIKDSSSWKIGRAITSVPRAIKRIARGAR